MATCLIPDFPAVNVALEHLGELDKQLRAERVSFSQEASHHLRQIAEAVKELEASRKAAREELEVETIETGKLRHRLLSQHHDIAAEISAAVAAARDANAAELNHLHLETANILEEIETMEKRQKLLEEQNLLISNEPEHRCLNANYAELIEQLNTQLSQKADMQIRLNDTRNEIQSTRERIARVHTARKDLQDNLIRQRRQFEETKSMLEKEISDMMSTIQEQATMNTEKQKELDVALSKLKEKEKRVDELSHEISLLESSMDGLKTSQQKYEERIKDTTVQSAELVKQKELREKELQELRKELNLQLLGLQENIRAVEREIEEEQKQNSTHLNSISELSSIFKVQRKMEDDALANHSNMNKELEKSKHRLDERFASIARYKLEIKQMEEEIKQLQETNKGSVEAFQKNLVELEGRLTKEKKNRAALEVDRDEVSVRIETLKEQHEDRMKNLSSAITGHRTRYNELEDEKEKLGEHEAMSCVIKEVTRRISGAVEECEQTEMKYNEEIQQLSMEAESVTRDRLDEEQQLKDQEKVLSKVEAQFDLDYSRHQALKQQTTELKARKHHLELSILEVKERTAAMLQLKEDLKEELQTSRQRHLLLLNSQAEQISATERSVYDYGLMLEQVKMENGRLHLRIEQMKEDVSKARTERQKHRQEMSWMKEEVQTIYSSLLDAWVKDKLATEDSSLQDQKLLEALQTFALQVQDRTQSIGDINGRLEAELKAMSLLLESTGKDMKQN